jgi:hypothetical protein
MVDFLVRCVPMTTPPSTGLVSISICTQTTLLEKGLRSFPAEHASIPFAGLSFLALQIAGLANLFRPRIPAQHPSSSSPEIISTSSSNYPGRWIGVFVLGVVSPLILAGWCAWSKVLDNRYEFPIKAGEGRLIVDIMLRMLLRGLFLVGELRMLCTDYAIDL